MKIFLDTEFIEDGKTIDLLSIGLVAEDGREFYRVNPEADLSKANEWVKEHVLPHLGESKASTKTALRELITLFCGETPCFWGYYADYDWVALCQLFGTMMDLPKGWPMYCRDLRQALDEKGFAEIKQNDNSLHHALEDARWIAKTYTNYCAKSQ